MSRGLQIACSKMSGSGNTFALIDDTQGSSFSKIEKLKTLGRPSFVKELSSSVSGIGVDGVLFLQDGSKGSDYTWDFYNSDGSKAEMCGNAARCAAVFARDVLKFSKEQIVFLTGAGLVTTQILVEDIVQVTMPVVKIIDRSLGIKTHNDVNEKFFFVNTGVPHLVQKIHDMNDVAGLKEMAREVRSHEDLGQAGSNVTFFQEISSGEISAVTFERGVEDYTLACGTGAVAAAYAYYENNHFSKVQVQMPGGVLTVEIPGDNSAPKMTGSAVVIGSFDFNFKG